MAIPMKKPVNPTSTGAEAGAEAEGRRYTYTDHIKFLGVGTSETWMNWRVPRRTSV